MIFGAIPLDGAAGAILAHATRHKDGVFKKGRVLSSADIDLLRAQGHVSVVAARLEPTDVPEDEAARVVSKASGGRGAKVQEPFTGRANIHASAKGILVVDEGRLSAINNLHESLTIATLPNFTRVEPRQMVATIKVIPFAVPRDVLDRALALLRDGPILHVSEFQANRVGLIITRLPQTKASVIAKSESAIRDRLQAMDAVLGQVTICDHDATDVAAAITEQMRAGLEPVLIFGASAIVDRADVIPAAVVKAGGEVVHFGMPVDPGNLMMLARHGEVPVVGIPSCARSPKVNGFDWVLERLIAGLPVTSSDVMGMGAGGLLAEIPSRPSPREARNAIPSAPRITAVVLAAGLSSRMGHNKLLADFHGKPMFLATLQTALESSADEVILVLGHEGSAVETMIDDNSRIRVVRNPDFAQGIGTSVRCGVEAAQNAEAVVICLADMPLVKPRTIDRLIAGFNPIENRTIVVPTFKGQFGNPVLWGREHFARLMALAGDRGARSLIAELKSEAIEIEVDDPGILADADTPQALAALRSA